MLNISLNLLKAWIIAQYIYAIIHAYLGNEDNLINCEQIEIVLFPFCSIYFH